MANKVAVGGASAAVLLVAGGLIAKWEGVRYLPYYDAVGVLTVCYGHTGRDIVPGKEYTLAECRELLNLDMQSANATVRRCLPMPLLRQIEISLTSGVFNLGGQLVCGSTLQRKAQANDWPGACAELSRWDKAGGRVLRGLTLRRGDERAICEGK